MSNEETTNVFGSTPSQPEKPDQIAWALMDAFERHAAEEKQREEAERKAREEEELKKKKKEEAEHPEFLKVLASVNNFYQDIYNKSSNERTLPEDLCMRKLEKLQKSLSDFRKYNRYEDGLDQLQKTGQLKVLEFLETQAKERYFDEEKKAHPEFFETWEAVTSTWKSLRFSEYTNSSELLPSLGNIVYGFLDAYIDQQYDKFIARVGKQSSIKKIVKLYRLKDKTQQYKRVYYDLHMDKDAEFIKDAWSDMYVLNWDSTVEFTFESPDISTQDLKELYTITYEALRYSCERTEGEFNLDDNIDRLTRRNAILDWLIDKYNKANTQILKSVISGAYGETMSLVDLGGVGLMIGYYLVARTPNIMTCSKGAFVAFSEGEINAIIAKIVNNIAGDIYDVMRSQAKEHARYLSDNIEGLEYKISRYKELLDRLKEYVTISPAMIKNVRDLLDSFSTQYNELYYKFHMGYYTVDIHGVQPYDLNAIIKDSVFMKDAYSRWDSLAKQLSSSREKNFNSLVEDYYAELCLDSDKKVDSLWGRDISCSSTCEAESLPIFS